MHHNYRNYLKIGPRLKAHSLLSPSFDSDFNLSGRTQGFRHYHQNLCYCFEKGRFSFNQYLNSNYRRIYGFASFGHLPSSCQKVAIVALVNHLFRHHLQINHFQRRLLPLEVTTQICLIKAATNLPWIVHQRAIIPDFWCGLNFGSSPEHHPAPAVRSSFALAILPNFGQMEQKPFYLNSVYFEIAQRMVH